MTIEERLELEKAVVKALRTVYDPEIPVNVFDLGLIYELDVDDDRVAHVKMTLTAPNCPMADQLMEEVRYNVASVTGIAGCELTLTFEPPWDRSMLSDEAMLELGLL